MHVLLHVLYNITDYACKTEIFVVVSNCYCCPLARYSHGSEVLEGIKRETRAILSDALLQRGLLKVHL